MYGAAPGALEGDRARAGRPFCFEVCALNYLYAGIWFLAGLVLMLRLRQENRVFLVAGAFFVVLGLWWLCAALFPEWDVFNGVPGVVLKVLTAVVLVVCGAVFWRENRKNAERAKRED